MSQNKPKPSQNPTLESQTQQKMQEFMATLDDTARATLTTAFTKLLDSKIDAQAKRAGDQAVDFTLQNVKGGETRLSQMLQQGPVVLNFYRGGWCPFCNLEFNALQRILPEIHALGAKLIGVSPETPDNSLSTVEKHQLKFEVLSDIGNKVARDYGLLMQVYEEIRPLYLDWGIDLPQANGDNSYELPLPATYVIDTAGLIRAAHVDKNYTRRMEPSDILTALHDIQG